MAAPASLVRLDEKEVYSTAIRIYSWTPTTFIKREVPPERRQKNLRGEWIIDPFVKELLQIEASALKLLSKTKIKVPKLIDSGLDKNGLAFVETELWSGIPGSRVREECRMPDGEKHVDTGECTLCEEKAWTNAESYIINVVLPEFEELRSKTMGLDGKLVPPPWVRYHDNRPTWIPKPSDTDRYVFCNWDVGPHNMMFEDGTLEVIGAYDWEGAGFLPPEFQFVNRSRQEFDAQFEDVPKVRRLIELLDA
ncbi:uncharacterized protein BDR25DRAFT_274295 [Lindgomyces ingoldianus]|uniref:Uncharacterized protein n=1 Tax=Lindgomyces ingoldianus TaxID=673940 RepID=A0ACB6Q705_9PLEO|nr:uncharacterized protein BDR25DRAFT_274295 [Lindgomyces ingoldianus]KAF2462600.1 hypothetical protein BDR25DRAFT_274295 [Lindgomyces ingoldianus]